MTRRTPRSFMACTCELSIVKETSSICRDHAKLHRQGLIRHGQPNNIATLEKVTTSTIADLA